MSIGRGLTKFGKIVSKNSPLLLSVLGAASIASTAILAAKAAPKAKKCVDETKDILKEEEDPEKIKHIKTTMCIEVAKLYAPAVLSGVAGVACIIGAHKINTNRQLALAATCALTEKKFEDYQKEAKELLGEKKESEIREKVAENIKDTERFQKAPFVKAGPGGEVLFYDEISGRKFFSTHEKIESAINAVNAMRMDHPDEEIYVNDFYDALEMDNTISGSMLGWKPYDKFRQKVGLSRTHASVEDEYGRELPCFSITLTPLDTILH